MSGKTILVLSDEAEIAEIWSHACSLRGIRADIALIDWTPEALADASRHSLCVIDVNDGRENLSYLCELMRRNFENPILVFTYEQDERYHRALYAAGVDEAVTKPVGVQLLLAKVCAWLARATAIDD